MLLRFKKITIGKLYRFLAMGMAITTVNSCNFFDSIDKNLNENLVPIKNNFYDVNTTQVAYSKEVYEVSDDIKVESYNGGNYTGIIVPIVSKLYKVVLLNYLKIPVQYEKLHELKTAIQKVTSNTSANYNFSIRMEWLNWEDGLSSSKSYMSLDPRLTDANFDAVSNSYIIVEQKNTGVSKPDKDFRDKLVAKGFDTKYTTRLRDISPNAQGLIDNAEIFRLNKMGLRNQLFTKYSHSPRWILQEICERQMSDDVIAYNLKIKRVDLDQIEIGYQIGEKNIMKKLSNKDLINLQLALDRL
jgi:hypothetical protein